jgi:hypothetical protein
LQSDSRKATNLAKIFVLVQLFNHKIMKSILFLFSLAILALLTSGCWDIQTGTPFKHIAPGAWRGVFIFDQEPPKKLMKVKKDSMRNERIPVVFQVVSNKQGLPKSLLFVDGTDSLRSDSLRIKNDTLFAYFDRSQTYMRLVYEINLMEGVLYDLTEKNYPIRFQAQSGVYPRFPDIRRKPIADVSGQWQTQIADNESDSMSTCAMNFVAKDNNVSVNIQATPFAPALSLEGTIQGKQIYLSGFNGRTAAQLSAEITPDGKALQKATLRINDQLYSFIAQR